MRTVQMLYSGHVQGVGFRYTVQREATALHCTGWVRNLMDGRVEVLITGNEESIMQLIERISDVFEHHIRTVQKIWKDSVESGVSFEIKPTTI